MIGHPVNWVCGWALLLAAFAIGAAIGLFVHRDDFLGGYTSYRRRTLRLGHIALAALGMLNLIFALSPVGSARRAAADLLIAGGVLMPLVCFATAVWPGARRAFVLPVAALIGAVILILFGALS